MSNNTQITSILVHITIYMYIPINLSIWGIYTKKLGFYMKNGLLQNKTQIEMLKQQVGAQSQ